MNQWLSFTEALLSQESDNAMFSPKKKGRIHAKISLSCRFCGMEAGRRSLLSGTNHVPNPVRMTDGHSNTVVMNKFCKSRYCCSKKGNAMLASQGKKKVKSWKICANANKDHQFHSHLDEFESQFVIVRSKRLKERRLKQRKITKIPKYNEKDLSIKFSEKRSEKEDQGLNMRNPLRFFPWGMKYHKFLTKNEEMNHIIKVQKLMKLEEEKKEFISRYNREPTNKEWAHLVSMSSKDLESCIINGNLSLEKIIRTNFLYVARIAKQYDGNGVFLADLVQEGNRAIMKSLKKFDVNKGYRFRTYAHWWIHHYMRNCICEYPRLIHIPMRLYEVLRKIEKARKSCIEERIVPKNYEIASRVGISIDTLRKVIWYGREPSCDYQFYIEQHTNNEDLVTMLRGEYIIERLKILNPRERFIIEQRFGLIDGKSKTLEEIGSIFGITRERVRQIESRALDKLRKIVSKEDLARFVSFGCNYGFSPAEYDWEKIIFWTDYISRNVVAS